MRVRNLHYLYELREIIKENLLLSAGKNLKIQNKKKAPDVRAVIILNRSTETSLSQAIDEITRSLNILY